MKPIIDILGIEASDFGRALEEGAVTACVVGLGYVGLPLAVILAERGFRVVGVDQNRGVLDACEAGLPSIHEEGLRERLGGVIRARRIQFSDDLAGSVRRSNLVVVTVGTPLTESRQIDLTGVRAAAAGIAAGLRQGTLVVFKSTMAVGGTRNTVEPILESISGMRAERDFGLAFVPERTVEGKALYELPRLPKIVGGLGERSSRAAAMVFSVVGGPIVTVSRPEVAEMAKLFDNIYRDVNIALANELAVCCEAAGVDAIETIGAANEGYERTHLLMPGPGVGGSCLTKDSYIFAASFSDNGCSPRLMMEARRINDGMPGHLAELTRDALAEMGKTLVGARVAVLGYAMKSGTDDVRGTPVRPYVRWLREQGVDVVVYDPLISAGVVTREVQVAQSPTLEEAVAGASVVCLATDHRDFSALDITALKSAMATPCALVDARHVVDPVAVMHAGFVYRGVGRPASFFRKGEA
ncbi:MAG: nucleotide sugar dehydrogenase [Dehalococcoidia bacterium]|jgi:UDP-N-acetyl-D-mannosaminuronic acid dehydrogenase|nr:nucleotide sugar dehydrogenase [Dehalococcoidia bacterium]